MLPERRHRADPVRGLRVQSLYPPWKTDGGGAGGRRSDLTPAGGVEC